MRPLTPKLAFLLLLALSPRLEASILDGYSDARATRAMLPPDTWARIARIDNSHPRGRWAHAIYPKTVYALVFELSGVLWIYTDAEGTESLSRTRGTLERDKADPGPLFRAIEPGAGAWTWVDDPLGAESLGLKAPPNACVEESLLALNRRMALGAETLSPELLFYYVNTPYGKLGHTVLLFRSAGALSAIDPQLSPDPVRIPPDVATDIHSMSEYLRGAPVASAKALPVEAGRRSGPANWAAVPVAADRRG